MLAERGVIVSYDDQLDAKQIIEAGLISDLVTDEMTARKLLE